MSRARDLANLGDGIDTSSITSGTFADARIAQSNVTQHESAIDALGTVASGTFNGTIGTSASLPAGTVVQTEYQYHAYNGTPTQNATTNVGSSVTVLYPCTKILLQIVTNTYSPTIYAAHGTYSIGYGANATISVATSSVVGSNASYVGGDTGVDGDRIVGTNNSSKLFIRNSGSPAYFDTGVTIQPSVTVGVVYSGAYFGQMGIHIFFIK